MNQTQFSISKIWSTILGDDYYVITSAGYVKDGPLSVKRDFADISSLPITAAFTVNEKDYQKTTHIIAVR